MMLRYLAFLMRTGSLSKRQFGSRFVSAASKTHNAKPIERFHLFTKRQLSLDSYEIKETYLSQKVGLVILLALVSYLFKSNAAASETEQDELDFDNLETSGTRVFTGESGVVKVKHVNQQTGETEYFYQKKFTDREKFLKELVAGVLAHKLDPDHFPAVLFKAGGAAYYIFHRVCLRVSFALTIYPNGRFVITMIMN